MTDTFKGLTWDHPRGKDALFAAAARIDPDADGLRLVWDVQPLEGFESAPIADLCARYDVVVMDHPHLGEALAHGCLRPWNDLVDPEWIAALEHNAVGPSLASYQIDGQTWALPLDAATQVSAARSDLMEKIPDTWDDVLALAESTGRVALSWGGPHPILSMISICVAYGETPGRGDRFVTDRALGRSALKLLARLALLQPEVARAMNPIGLLDHMTARDDVSYCPLVYGYVNYAAPQYGRALTFANAPRGPGGRRGSVIGGTGLAISARSTPSQAFVEHLTGLLSEEVQRSFIPANNGQPSLRCAWQDPDVNARSGDFYINTVETIEAAYVRPRFNGYIAFQTGASEILRKGMKQEAEIDDILDGLEDCWESHVQRVDAL